MKNPILSRYIHLITSESSGSSVSEIKQLFWKILLGRRKPRNSKLLRCLNKLNSRQVDESLSTGSRFVVAAEKLTITFIWDVPGMLDGWCHLWNKHYFSFETPCFGHMYMLIEVIMFWTPSVQICDWSHSNMKKNYDNEKTFEGKSVRKLKFKTPLITPSFQQKLPTKLGFWDISVFWKILLQRRKPRKSIQSRHLSKPD